MAEKIKKQFKRRIKAINKSIEPLLALTEGISLLHPVNERAKNIALSVKAVKKEGKGLSGKELMNVLRESETIELLDELVDDDVLNELEDGVLKMIEEDSENEAIIDFINQLITKLEQRYTQMIESVHAFNALIG